MNFIGTWVRTIAEALRGRAGTVLALTAGLVIPLGFAPFGWWPLVPLALAALALTWLDVPPRQALVRGYLAGIGCFGAGVWWVFVSFHEFGHIPVVPAAAITLAFILVLALFPGLVGWLTASAARRTREGALLLGVFPALWVLLEWLRGWLFTGFPWLYAGYSQVEGPLSGLAPLGGVLLVSYGVVLSAGALAFWFRAGLRAGALAGVSLAVLWGAALGLGAVTWTEADEAPVQIALVQGNIDQREKWTEQMRSETLQRYASLTREHRDADVVLWPETALPLYYHQARDYLTGLREELDGHGVTLGLGVPVWDATSGRIHNSIVVLGESDQFYHKRHLVPFGEYLPLQDLLGGLVAQFSLMISEFTPGPDDQPALEAAGVSLAPSICYEAAYPGVALANAREAGLLINVSNDAWFGDSIAPHQHLQIARMRALESGRPMLRATNTGVTAVIDAQGRLVKTLDQFEVGVLTASVTPRSGVTPFLAWGSAPVLLLILVAGLAGLGWRRGHLVREHATAVP